MPDCSVSGGVMKRKVWAATKSSLMVCSILGMWHATHWLPALPSAWWVCSATVPFSPAGFSLRVAAQAERVAGDGQVAMVVSLWTWWQSKQRSSRWYMVLWTKSLPCMRFLWAVRSAYWKKLVVPGFSSSSFQ